MKNWFLKIIHYLAATLVGMIITFAFFVALLRVEAPVVAGEAPTIAAYLTQKLHHPVKLQSVSLKWHYIMPVLELTNIEIFKSNIDPQKIFAIHKLSVGVRFIPSLRHRELLLRYFFVDGLNLSLVHDQTGQWKIKGLSDLDFISLTGASDVRKSLKLEGKNLSLYIDGVFVKPILIQNFTARLIVEKTQRGSTIMLNKININNQDLEATGNIAFFNNNMNIKLKYHLFSSIILHIDNYLPHNFLHPQLLRWLPKAVQKLDSGDGVFILEGPLEDFPYTTKPGKFIVETYLKNMTLNYNSDWPIASHLDGKLIFQNNSMQMHIVTAEINHIKADDINAVIPDLDAGVLNITGKISADSKDLLQFIQQSPLKKTVGKYVEGYQWSGPAQLQLGLSIPLTSEAKPDQEVRLKGLLSLKQNTLSMTPQSTLRDLTADIRFNENGIIGENKLKSILWGIPLWAVISSDKYWINYDQWRFVFNNRGRQIWKVDVFHPQLVGLLTIAGDFPPQSISGQFRYLTIPRTAPSSPSASLKQTIEPRKVPPLNIVIDNFRYHDMSFGRVNFNTSSIRGGLKLNNLQSVMGKTTINMNGLWVQTKQGRYSSIGGDFTSRSMTDTLKNWGITPSIQSSFAAGTYAFEWPGNLYSPDIQNLSGKIHFEVGKGEILNVSSQAKMDIGRLLTLLSFQSLGKRLRLDFSDLTTVGLNFESLSGDFQFNHGIASTSNTKLKGPLSSIHMTGSIDLINQTYQLKLLVTPHLTSSLPIIATIAGGPVAGAAIWLADKIFNPLLDKITSDTYTITGPWDKPVIK